MSLVDALVRKSAQRSLRISWCCGAPVPDLSRVAGASRCLSHRRRSSLSHALFLHGCLQTVALTMRVLHPAGVFANLSTVALNNNELTGALPNSWGEDGNLPSLQSLDVSANNLTGSLPSVWGHNGSFYLLTNLNLANNTLSGSLPTSWADAGRFPALQQLEVQYNQLSGAQAEALCQAAMLDR